MANNGDLLATIVVSDYARQVEGDGTLTLTNAPEPEPLSEPEPTPEMTTAEAELDLLTDINYRLSLVELGLTEGDKV